MRVTFEQAVLILESNNIVAIPTDTVYGLAGRAYSADAVKKIFQTKGRPQNRPLIVHYGVKPLWETDVIWNHDAELLANRFWPGPLTMILPLRVKSKIAREVTGLSDSLAIRRPKLGQMSALCDLIGPLAAPSANKYQKLSATTSEMLRNLRVPFLDGEECSVGLESTIIDLRSKPYIVQRIGSVTIEELRATGLQVEMMKCESNLPGSGAHYQPDKPLRLNATTVCAGEAVLNFGNSNLVAPCSLNLSVNGNLDEAAFNLYRMLHCLDSYDCNAIVVAPIPNFGSGCAINDRLQRAARAR